MKKLLEQRGDFTLNGAFILLFIVAGIMLSISVLGVASTSVRLHSMANELMRYTEVRGRVDASVYAELARLETASGLDVDCTISGEYIAGTNKVQFGDTITIQATCKQAFGIGGILRAPITLRTVVSGRSELFWK